MTDIIDITYENFSKKKIAVKEIKYMEAHDKVPLKKYKVLHKKGDMDTIVEFKPFPHLKKVPFEETVFKYPDYSGFSVIKTESELLAMHDDILIEDDVVYYKPCIIICYAEERRLRIWFDTFASALKTWENFKYRFGDGLKCLV